MAVHAERARVERDIAEDERLIRDARTRRARGQQALKELRTALKELSQTIRGGREPK